LAGVVPYHSDVLQDWHTDEEFVSAMSFATFMNDYDRGGLR